MAATRSPLMLIHGAWLSSRSWDPFAEYFRDRGYDVSAPEWPRKQGDVEELREATDAIEALVHGLADAESLVRAACAWALGHMGDARAWQALHARLAVEADESVAGELRDAISAMHVPPDLPP